ncbi:hypothetical protein DFQ26_003548, partial [Actinomortierella ambigua]
PGKVVEAPYRIHEPIFFLLQRLACLLGLEIEGLRGHMLAIDGIMLRDVKTSLAENRVFGNILTYEYLEKKVDSVVNFQMPLGKNYLATAHLSTRLYVLMNAIRKIEGDSSLEPLLNVIGVKEAHTLEHCGIKYGDDITVTSVQCGGGPSDYRPLIPFVDVQDRSSIRRIKLSRKAPRGRLARDGINIECRCKCTPKYDVICCMDFTIVELDKTKFVCPNCNSSDKIQPVTVGLMECKYRFMGLRESGEQYTSGWSIVKRQNEYQLFDSSKQVKWQRLLIQAQPRDERDVCIICLRTSSGIKTYDCGHPFHDECYAKVGGWCFSCKFDKQLQLAYTK